MTIIYNIIIDQLTKDPSSINIDCRYFQTELQVSRKVLCRSYQCWGRYLILKSNSGTYYTMNCNALQLHNIITQQ